MKRAVVWSPQARADIKALDRQIAMEIFRAIDRYLTTQEGDVKRLHPPLKGHRLRVGDWRVFFKPLQAANAIHVSRVLHRREAYR